MIKGGRRLGLAIRITEIEGPSGEAAAAIDEAVHILRSSMNWLEDTHHFEAAHQRLDQAGAYRREHFPHQCRLALDEQGYAVVCPVWLGHNRVGLSPGYIVRAAECSICRRDPEDCEHISGRTYDGETCVRILMDLDLLEVSLVGRPAQPDARIERISVADSDLREQLGPDFRRGIPVTCDRCLNPCKGVSRPFGCSSQGVLGEQHSPLS